MIYSELGWPDAIEKGLYPMSMDHTVHLHNHNTHISSDVSPEEFWTRSNSSHSSQNNSRPWVYPAYFLEKILQDGKKLPTWMPSYRRTQYLGYSPINARTVGLVSNLYTGNIIPQFHLFFDDYFDTVHEGKDQEPPNFVIIYHL